MRGGARLLRRGVSEDVGGDLCQNIRGHNANQKIIVGKRLKQHWQAGVSAFLPCHRANAANDSITIGLVWISQCGFKAGKGRLSKAAQRRYGTGRSVGRAAVLHQRLQFGQSGECVSAKYREGRVGMTGQFPISSLQPALKCVVVRYPPREMAAEFSPPSRWFITNPFQEVGQRIGANVQKGFSHLGEFGRLLEVNVAPENGEPLRQRTALVVGFVRRFQKDKGRNGQGNQAKQEVRLSPFRLHIQRMEVLRG